ncbi:MAG: C13 family peptidase [Pseudomonadota bacterium]
MHPLLQNLRAGLRIGLGRRFDPDAVHVDAHQAVGLFLIALALTLLADFIHTEPEREFNAWGVISHLATYALFLFAAYLAAQAHRRLDRFGLLLIVMLAAEPVGRGVAELYRQVAESADDMWTAWGVYALLVGWFYWVAYRAQSRVFASGRGRTAVAAAVYMGVLVANSLVLPHADAWYTVYTGDEAPEKPVLDVEATYYAQPELLAAALDGLQPQRPGVPDIYFVGVAGWAEQDVFLREVRAVRELFDTRFDTAGRSLLLINNPQTVGEVPLANATNLQRVLRRLGEVMDPEEDMLFLYLTSHGSREHEFAMHYWPLRLNDIPAARLGAMLAESPIRWRAVVISACYSGGFIPPLNDAGSLVLTAAAADRQSFGCSNENAWTYFGEAYFERALKQTRSFTAAFQQAAGAIAEREAREKLEPSLPQSWVGEEMAAYLPRLEQHLATLDAAAPAALADCGATSAAETAPCR